MNKPGLVLPLMLIAGASLPATAFAQTWQHFASPTIQQDAAPSIQEGIERWLGEESQYLRR
jgi:hypothetical protein